MDMIIKFGKYKGKPVEELLKDESYCIWLKKQKWVSSWLKELLHKKTFCGICNDYPEGMYLGEGEYGECVACGWVGRWSN